MSTTKITRPHVSLNAAMNYAKRAVDDLSRAVDAGIERRELWEEAMEAIGDLAVVVSDAGFTNESRAAVLVTFDLTARASREYWSD